MFGPTYCSIYPTVSHEKIKTFEDLYHVSYGERCIELELYLVDYTGIFPALELLYKKSKFNKNTENKSCLKQVEFNPYCFPPRYYKEIYLAIELLEEKIKAYEKLEHKWDLKEAEFRQYSSSPEFEEYTHKDYEAHVKRSKQIDPNISSETLYSNWIHHVGFRNLKYITLESESNVLLDLVSHLRRDINRYVSYLGYYLSPLDLVQVYSTLHEYEIDYFPLFDPLKIDQCKTCCFSFEPGYYSTCNRMTCPMDYM